MMRLQSILFATVVVVLQCWVLADQRHLGVHMYAQETCHPPYCATTRLFANDNPYNAFAEVELPDNPAAFFSAAKKNNNNNRHTRDVGGGGGWGGSEAEMEKGKQAEAEDERRLRNMCHNLPDSASEELRLSCRRFAEKDKMMDAEEMRRAGLEALEKQAEAAGPTGSWESEIFKMASKYFGRNKKTDFLFEVMAQAKREHQQELHRQEKVREKMIAENKMMMQVQQEDAARNDMHETRKSFLLHQGEDMEDVFATGTRGIPHHHNSASPSNSPFSPSTSPSVSVSPSTSPSPSQSASPSQSPLYPIEFTYPEDIQGIY